MHGLQADIASWNLECDTVSDGEFYDSALSDGDGFKRGSRMWTLSSEISSEDDRRRSRLRTLSSEISITGDRRRSRLRTLSSEAGFESTRKMSHYEGLGVTKSLDFGNMKLGGNC